MNFLVNNKKLEINSKFNEKNNNFNENLQKNKELNKKYNDFINNTSNYKIKLLKEKMSTRDMNNLVLNDICKTQENKNE